MRKQVKRDLDETKDQILSDLTAEERLREVLNAVNEDHQEWAVELQETTPKETHKHREVDYVAQRLAADRLAYQAVYRMNSLRLRYYWVESSRQLLTVLEGDEPNGSDTMSIRKSDASQILVRLNEVIERYDEFAQEQLDVTLEDWLGVTHEGQAVLRESVKLLIEHCDDIAAEKITNQEENGANTEEAITSKSGWTNGV